jgi:thiamine-monophosphate kinase
VSGGEFDQLRAIFARLGSAAAGLGDDCALIPVGGTTMALSIDASLEGVHFRTDWLSFEEIGWRAAGAALSDLAAAGAVPIGVLVSLGVPDAGGAAQEIMAGVGACAVHVGGKVLGGDLARSERYFVDVAVVGTAAHPVRRRGAAAGDGVWVTGALGGPARALEALRAGATPEAGMRRRWARPEPRLAAGAWLAAHGARAMIDLSDGLAADAAHLAQASGVAVEIALERVPCWPGVDPLAAAASGEEYELLVALPAGFSEAAAAELERAGGAPLTRIGRCADGTGVRLTLGGRPVPAPPGWDHFAP